MWYEELGNQVILFGEAKKGRKFTDVVGTGPNYCNWFLRKWGSSPKKGHQMFSLFLSMWTERQELEHGTPPRESPRSLKGRNFASVPQDQGQANGTAGSKSSVSDPFDLELEDEEELVGHV